MWFHKNKKKSNEATEKSEYYNKARNKLSTCIIKFYYDFFMLDASVIIVSRNFSCRGYFPKKEKKKRKNIKMYNS